MHKEGNPTVTLVCDFCLTPTGFGYYRTEPFTLYGQVGFDAKWLVCELCFCLIEDEQWAMLSNRAIAGCIKKQEEIEKRALPVTGNEHWHQLVPQLVAKFREFKSGGIVREEKRRDAEEAPRPTTNPGNKDTVAGS